MNTRIFARLVMLALAAACIAPATSSAATYHVQQCHSASGYGVAQGWNYATGGSYGGSIQGCTAGYFRMQDAVGGGTDWLMLHPPTLPASITYAAVSFNYFAQGGANAAVGPARLRQCTSAAVAPLCVGSGPTIPATGGSAGTIGAYCTVAGGQPCKNIQFEARLDRAKGHFWFGDVDFTLVDPAAPVAHVPQGGSLASSQNTTGPAWNRGDRTVQIAAADADSGAKGVDAYVDSPSNKASVPTPVGCPGPYVEFQPCPGSYSQTATIKTAGLSDGQHTLFNVARDAADNIASSAVTFSVDNTPPAPPTSVIVTPAGDPRSAAGQFNLSWTNEHESGPDATRSGVAQVLIDLDPSGGQGNPAPVSVPVGSSAGGISAAVNAAAGVSVPDRAPWRLTLQLVDAAGNVSAKSDPVDVRLPAALNNGSGGDPGSATMADVATKSVIAQAGSSPKLTARLVDASGAPIAGAKIDVYEQINVAGSKRKKVGSVTTDAEGGYSYKPKANASKVVTFAYSPSGTDSYTVKRYVTVVVRSPLTLKAKSTSVAAGGLLKLRGKIRASGMRKGVVVEIQVKDGRTWRTVATRRSSKNGRFKFSYRFKAGGTFAFRARVRKSSDLPIASSASRRVTVRVG